MLRRKPTAITLTSEDVAAYEDRQAALALNAESAAAASATASASSSSQQQRHVPGLQSSQALIDLEAAHSQQPQQHPLHPGHGLHQSLRRGAYQRQQGSQRLHGQLQVQSPYGSRVENTNGNGDNVEAGDDNDNDDDDEGGNDTERDGVGWEDDPNDNHHSREGSTRLRQGHGPIDQTRNARRVTRAERIGLTGPGAGRR